jgi:hypothetical protein
MMGRVRELADQIRASVVDAEVDFTSFPSGSATIDVRRGGRLFVLSYSPTHHFAVDEVADGEGFQVGYRFTSESFESATARLQELIANAIVCGGGGRSSAPCATRTSEGS